MKDHTFRPGFRISVFDALILLVGALGTGFGYFQIGPLTLLIAFVTGHFFLFCNVFRIARGLELLWAGLFTALSAATITWRIPTWSVTIALSFLATTAVILVEMRKPSYHGAGWRRINPGLPEWWESQDVASLRHDSQRPITESIT